MNYSAEELIQMGIRLGQNVQVHRSVLFFNAHRIKIGSNVRIDAHSILSTSENGYIEIGCHVHIAAGCYFFGSHGLRIHDFAGISSRVAIYTASDDYTEGHLTGPTVPAEYKKIVSGPVTIKRHCIVGTSSTILPGVTLQEGAAVGAHSLVTREVLPFQVVAGCPAKKIKLRDQILLKHMESVFLEKNVLSLEDSIP